MGPEASVRAGPARLSGLPVCVKVFSRSRLARQCRPGGPGAGAFHSIETRTVLVAVAGARPSWPCRIVMSVLAVALPESPAYRPVLDDKPRHRPPAKRSAGRSASAQGHRQAIGRNPSHRRDHRTERAPRPRDLLDVDRRRRRDVPGDPQCADPLHRRASAQKADEHRRREPTSAGGSRVRLSLIANPRPGSAPVKDGGRRSRRPRTRWPTSGVPAALPFRSRPGRMHCDRSDRRACRAGGTAADDPAAGGSRVSGRSKAQ